MIQKNAISWFEIGTTDLERAAKFYETIFNISLVPLDMADLKMRMFPVSDMQEGVGGALINGGGMHIPSATDGPLIYLNASPDLQAVLNKVETAGGKILLPKEEISPEFGYMAIIIDTEGNRIGLHSNG
ncbi:MAG: VOC family protein [Sphingobacteriales bacterium]|nr:MAG: VOC family protein [Sphingobacteriales bacterium]